MADEKDQAGMAQDAGTDAPDDTEPTTDSAGTNDNAAEQLDKMRAALNKANREAAKFRKEAEAAAKAEEERKQAEMTEAEKLKSRLIKLEAEVAAKEKRIHETEIKGRIERAARTLNLREEAVTDAVALLAMEGLDDFQPDDEGNYPGIDDALKALVKSRPFWTKQPEQQGGLDADKGQGSGKGPENNEAYDDSLRSRFRIRR